MVLLDQLGHGLLIACGMAWKTGWSLILGFAISAFLQVVTPSDRLKALLGKNDAKVLAIATAAGAASSSCSYASASIMRTLFKKGAALGPSLAFLVASTNLVLELGIILWLLMGWRFMVAEWVGGLVLIAFMAVIVRYAFPHRLIDQARAHEESGHGHDHGAPELDGKTWSERLHDPRALPAIGRAFAMEGRMLWKDLVAGFLIAGMLAAFVPASFWQTLFLSDAPAWLRIPADALIGPIVAMLTFVCSVGNVPLAAMLWSGGASFGGVIAFLYADLIVLPLLDAYRRYFGWRMAAALGLTLLASMVGAALVISLVFNVAGWAPTSHPAVSAAMTDFSVDYSFWLNLAALGLAAWLLLVSRRGPDPHDQHHHH